MARVNILKQVKDGDRWKLVAIPRNKKGDYDWESLAEGRYFVEWYERRELCFRQDCDQTQV